MYLYTADAFSRQHGAAWSLDVGGATFTTHATESGLSPHTYFRGRKAEKFVDASKDIYYCANPANLGVSSGKFSKRTAEH